MLQAGPMEEGIAPVVASERVAVFQVRYDIFILYFGTHVANTIQYNTIQCNATQRNTTTNVSEVSQKVSDGADLTFCGKAFHSREVAIGKFRSPMVERRVRISRSFLKLSELSFNSITEHVCIHVVVEYCSCSSTTCGVSSRRTRAAKFCLVFRRLITRRCTVTARSWLCCRNCTASTTP